MTETIWTTTTATAAGKARDPGGDAVVSEVPGGWPSEDSVRAAMEWAWRDHHHARDQTWKALQMEAVLGAGLITVDARYGSPWATLGIAVLVILTAGFGLMISWHHRKLERRKIIHVYHCEQHLGLHADHLIPVSGGRTNLPPEVRDAAVQVPRPVSMWQIFDLRKTNTSLFIMRMYVAIMVFAAIVAAARINAGPQRAGGGGPEPVLITGEP